MIKLACNYYPEVVQLLQEEIIDIDYFKFPSLGYQMSIFQDSSLVTFENFIKKISSLRPVMLHGLAPTNHNIGSKTFIQDFNVYQASKLLQIFDAKGISLHLSGIDLSLSYKENKKILLTNIMYLKEQFPHLEFLSLENVDGNPFISKNQFGICIDPQFISEIIYESNTDFLLDISHAYCSSKALDLSFESYLNALPLDKTYEIHINGWIETNTDIIAHTCINEVGYDTLNSLLKKYTPKILTLEYGRTTDRLNAGIPLMTPTQINNLAQEEIIKQLQTLTKIISANTAPSSNKKIASRD